MQQKCLNCGIEIASADDAFCRQCTARLDDPVDSDRDEPQSSFVLQMTGLTFIAVGILGLGVCVLGSFVVGEKTRDALVLCSVVPIFLIGLGISYYVDRKK